MALKIIGAGLGRTGTASLKVALEQLGIGQCYHMTEVMKDPANFQRWIDAADGNPDWETIFNGYAATVDYPGCSFWRELAEYYPDAKILLTVRDATSWFESVNHTIMSADFNAHVAGTPWGEMLDRTIHRTLDHRMDDRDFMIDYFERRTAEIEAGAPADRLLVYQVKQGWDPLCKFLGVPVPDEPFPHINSRDETRKLLETVMASGMGEENKQTLKEAAETLHPGEES
jgi:hypothetical protein